MNDNARKWVEALRSGDYQQTRRALRRDDGYCCLGVAVELYRQEHGGEWSHGEKEHFYIYAGSDATLPAAVEEWLALGTSAGSFRKTRDFCSSLAHENDCGASFAEIADLIESEPKGLFG